MAIVEKLVLYVTRIVLPPFCPAVRRELFWHSDLATTSRFFCEQSSLYGVYTHFQPTTQPPKHIYKIFVVRITKHFSCCLSARCYLHKGLHERFREVAVSSPPEALNFIVCYYYFADELVIIPTTNFSLIFAQHAAAFVWYTFLRMQNQYNKRDFQFSITKRKRQIKSDFNEWRVVTLIAFISSSITFIFLKTERKRRKKQLFN